MVGVADVSVCL